MTAIYSCIKENKEPPPPPRRAIRHIFKVFRLFLQEIHYNILALPLPKLNLT